MAESFKFDQDKFDVTKGVYVGILVSLGIDDPEAVLDELALLPAEKRHGTMFNDWIENHFGNKDSRKAAARAAFESLKTQEGREAYGAKMEQLGFSSELSPYVNGYLAEMSTKFIPYDTVLTAGIMVGEGQSLQMGCGEGKTGVLSMASYGILQDPNSQVFLTSSTSILAAEALDKLEFYEAVGLADKVALITPTGITRAKMQPDGKIERVKNSKGKMVPATIEESFEGMSLEQKKAALKAAYASPLVVSDNATLMQHSMEGFLDSPEDGKDRVLLADEADFVLLDSYRPMQKKADQVDRHASREEAYNILQELRSTISDNKFFVLDESTQYVDFTKDGRAAVVAAIESKFGNKPGVDKNEMFDFVYDALVVDTVYKEDRDYQLLNNGTQLVSEDRASGVAIELPEGVKQALEIKLKREGKYKGEFSPEFEVSDITNVQSFFKEYFTAYQFVSGTLGIDSQEIRREFAENFNLQPDDVYEIPPKAEGIRVDRGKTLFATPEEKRKAIVEDALREAKEGRPVLIGTISETEINFIREELQAQGYTQMPIIYTAASAGEYEAALTGSPETFKEKYGISLEGAPKSFADFIKANGGTPGDKENGKLGTIMLGTSIIGRGTTIAADDINGIGGIHVIIDGLHETSSRNQEQYKARTARGSNKGTTSEMFCIEDIPESARASLEEKGYDLSNPSSIDPKDLYAAVYESVDARTSSIRGYVVKFTEATRENLSEIKNHIKLDDVAKAEVAALLTERAFSIRNRACGVSNDFTEQIATYEAEIDAFTEMYIAKYTSPDKEQFDEKAWLEENGYGDIAATYIPFSKEREERIFTKKGLRDVAGQARDEAVKEQAQATQEGVRETANPVVEQHREDVEEELI